MSFFSKIWDNWNTDRIVALSAMSISILTLITFIYQTSLMKKQATLSVLPYLSVSSSYNTSSNPSFKLILINEGVGPAIIESRKVFFEGKEYKEEFFEFLKRQLPELDTMDHISHGGFDYGSVLPPGEEIYLIAGFDDRRVVDFLAGSLNSLNDKDLDYEIIYRSIYGERWRIDNISSMPEKLEDVKR